MCKRARIEPNSQQKNISGKLCFERHDNCGTQSVSTAAPPIREIGQCREDQIFSACSLSDVSCTDYRFYRFGWLSKCDRALECLFWSFSNRIPLSTGSLAKCVVKRLRTCFFSNLKKRGRSSSSKFQVRTAVEINNSFRREVYQIMF